MKLEVKGAKPEEVSHEPEFYGFGYIIKLNKAKGILTIFEGYVDEAGRQTGYGRELGISPENEVYEYVGNFKEGNFEGSGEQRWI